MLAENVSWVDFTRDVNKRSILGVDGLTYAMVGNYIVELGYFTVLNGRTIDNTFAFTKHIVFLTYWDSKVSQGETQFHQPFNGGSCGDELRAIRGSLNC